MQIHSYRRSFFLSMLLLFLLFFQALWIATSLTPTNIIYAWTAFFFFLLFLRFTEHALLLLFLLWGVVHIFIMRNIGFSFAGVDFTVGRLIGLVLIIGVSLRLFLEKFTYHRKILQHDVQWAFVIFVVWVGITIIYSKNKIGAYSEYIRLLSNLVLLLAIPIVATNRIRFIKMIVVCGMMAALFSILTYLKFTYGISILFLPSEASESISGVIRSVGSLGSSGGTAGLLLLTIGCSMYLYETSNSQAERWTYALSVLLMTLGTFATLIRTGIVGLALFFPCWAFIKAIKEKSFGVIFKISIGLIILVIIGAAFIGEEAIKARISDVPFISHMSIHDKSAGQGRIDLWTNILTDFNKADFKTKIIGRGMYGTYEVNTVYGAHNDYLQILTDSGIVGIIIYIFFLYYGLKLSVALSKKDNVYIQSYGYTLFAIIIAFSLSQSIFGGTITVTGHRWYFTAMLALGILADKKDTWLTNAKGQQEIKRLKNEGYLRPQ